MVRFVNRRAVRESNVELGHWAQVELDGVGLHSNSVDSTYRIPEAVVDMGGYDQAEHFLAWRSMMGS